MAYIKLNEVEKTDTPVDFNILIEEDGKIKRTPATKLSPAQVQADWSETDPTKPSFIKNKPESLGGNTEPTSGGKVVVFSGSSGSYQDQQNNIVSPQRVLEEWNAGSILRIAYNGYESNVISVIPQYSYNSLTASNELTTIKIVYSGGGLGFCTESIN